MAVSEVERMELVGRLKDAIGENAAETLMACILPDGRDQLATKADLEVLGAGLHAEMAGLRSYVESALAKQARLYYGTLVAFLLSVWGIFLAQNFM